MLFGIISQFYRGTKPEITREISNRQPFVSIYSLGLTGKVGLLKLFLQKVRKLEGRIGKIVNVLHNNPETFKSPFITAELSTLYYKFYFSFHVRSNPG